MNKKLSLAAVALATVVCAAPLRAQTPETLTADMTSGEVPYVLNSGNNVMRDNSGQCVRTGFWNIDAARTAKAVGKEFPIGCYCDKDLLPRSVCEAKPVALALVAEPTPAPAPAPVAPSVVTRKVSLPVDTLFQFDSANLTPAGQAKLREFAQEIKDVRIETVVAVGHADRIGTEQYNQKLSEKRAASVKEFLITQGLDSGVVFTEGRGEDESVTGSNCQRLGRETARNHRLVECLAPDRAVDVEAVGTQTVVVPNNAQSNNGQSLNDEQPNQMQQDGTPTNRTQR